MYERESIVGCADYGLLPFARNCVKQLRFSGLQFGSKSFVVNSMLVRVWIALDSSFIRIVQYRKKDTDTDTDTDIIGTGTGGIGQIISDLRYISILSGVVKGGDIVDGMLHRFKATAECQLNVLKRTGAASFRDENFLVQQAIELLRPEIEGDAQVKTVCPSMYSGRMQHAVQYVLGLTGKHTKQLQYNYTWSVTHIITKDTTGTFDYLVEISKYRGVTAIVLPVLEDDVVNNEAVRMAKEEFRYAPSGEIAPDDLAQLIAEKKAVQLMEPGELNDFYDGKRPWSEDHGWTTNSSGSEAHNVTFWSVPVPGTPPEEYILHNTIWTEPSGKFEDEEHAAHYKISISITATSEGLIASGSAYLSLVSTGRLYWGGEVYNPNTPTPVKAVAYSHTIGGFVRLRAEFIPEGEFPRVLRTSRTTVFVYFAGDTLKTVKAMYSNQLLMPYITPRVFPTYTHTSKTYRPYPGEPGYAWYMSLPPENQNGTEERLIDKFGMEVVKYYKLWQHSGEWSGSSFTEYRTGVSGSLAVAPVWFREEEEDETQDIYKRPPFAPYQYWSRSTTTFSPDPNAHWHMTTPTGHTTVGKSGSTYQAVIFARGMRNGWVELDAVAGARSTSSSSGPPGTSIDNTGPIVSDERTVVEGPPKIITESWATDDGVSGHSVITIDSLLLDVKWHHERAIPEHHFYGDKAYLLLETAVATEGQTSSRFDWAADASYSNSIRSPEFDVVVGDGELVADETTATNYSFVGYTGA